MSFDGKATKRFAAAVAYRRLLSGLPAPPPRGDCADIAVVCLAALGDFVVFCDAARALRERGKRIVLICRKGKGIEEFAELTGYFEQVIALPYGYRRRAKDLRELRRVRADTVIVAPMGRHAFSDLCVLSVSANRRILPDTMQGCVLPKLKRRIDRMVEMLIPVSAVNEQERYEQYLRGAGLFVGTIMPFAFDWAEDRKRRRRKLVAIFPGAGGGEFKCWPIERFAAVAKHLLGERNCEISVCGTEDEWELGGRLCSMVPGAVNRCGEMDIPTLLRFFRDEVSLCLCNDTGSAHLSIACGVPTVVICGGWEYGRFYPNPRLPEYCCAVVPDRDALGCIPCGKSRPKCARKGSAPCVCKTEKETVIIRSENVITDTI